MAKSKTYKRTNNDLLSTTQKTTNCATRTSPKIGGELMCSGRVSRKFMRKCYVLYREYISIQTIITCTRGIYIKPVFISDPTFNLSPNFF